MWIGYFFCVILMVAVVVVGLLLLPILWATRVCCVEWGARWRYARLYMRQNGYHMCISRFVRCLSIVSVSLWCYWNVIGAVLYFVRQQMLWPTNTISLIYCNGFKLCERQTAIFYCTHTHTVIFLIATPSFSITKIHLPIKINRNLFLISLMRTAWVPHLAKLIQHNFNAVRMQQILYIECAAW